jgi:uncharacterized repeat protein (TIGR03809 family)
MTHQLDVARSREIISRWCMLAERRLEYLTELFETGRWRRYHSELAFLENIQEAKAAVENWRKLLFLGVSSNGDAVKISWPTHRTAALLGNEPLRDKIYRPQPRAAEIPAEPPSGTASVPEARFASSDPAEASVARAMQEVSELTLDLAAIAERYPLLRNEL